MEISTKFNLNDSAWFMKDNRPKEVYISAIYTFSVGTNQDHIKYNGKDVIDSTSWLDNTDLHECMLFRTKGSLLKSLFGSDHTCKGRNCTAINGIDHSDECVIDHDAC